MIILIVEDKVEPHRQWAREFDRKGHTVFSAYSVQEALEIIENTPDIDVIVLDGCVNSYDSIDYHLFLVPAKVKYPNIPIIAASMSSELRKQMIKNGCTEQCPKEQVIQTVMWTIEELEQERG